MSKKENSSKTLSQFLETIVSEGRHYFTVEELIKGLQVQEGSLSVSLSRLSQKGRVKMIRRGFGIIMASHGGEPHPTAYVDAMLKHLDSKYYVGLLSAAAHWGAAHQAAMSYQIVVNKIIKKISYERSRIEFITKKGILPEKWIQRVAGPEGYYNISSPELTAIDLIRFPRRAGHLNNVATVLEDLVEKWDGRKMASLCYETWVPTVTLQRLGYLLDGVLDLRRESNYILPGLEKRAPIPSLLSTNKKNDKVAVKDFEYNNKWSLYLNTQVEPD